MDRLEDGNKNLSVDLKSAYDTSTTLFPLAQATAIEKTLQICLEKANQ